jgi:hypothetical protein
MDSSFSGVFTPAVLPLDSELLPGRDLVAVAKYLRPIDAHLVCGCLCAYGIPAVVADDHHVQADQLIAPALGGVRILVPLSHLPASQDILAAYERGELALDDDADVGNSA